MNSYEDILYLPHPTSKTHPRMSLVERAAQFSPFAALTGYEETTKEVARITTSRIQLDEYEKNTLNRQLRELQLQEHEQPEVRITYFIPDERKEGGVYSSVVGKIKKIDTYHKKVILQNKQELFMENILKIES